MRTIKQYFEHSREQTPKWLKEYKNGDRPSFNRIFNDGRIVYYPGSGYDGQPIKTFNIAHYSHTYFYVDYMVTKESIIERLTEDNALNGYKNIGIIEYKEKDLSPRGWIPHYHPSKEEVDEMKRFSNDGESYCLVFIFERDINLDDEHGCDRFAVIYLSGDAIATYDAMFANNNKAPDVLMLQDHGFGCNYNWFGRGGALNQIAASTNCYPSYIMVADNTAPWEHYEKIPNLHHAYSGHLRWLYKRIY